LAADRMPEIAEAAEHAVPLIQEHGDDERDKAVDAAHRLAATFRREHAMQEIPQGDRIGLRDDVFRIDAELKTASETKSLPKDQKTAIGALRGTLRGAVEYAPWWVRVLSAVCLGIGTMIGYKRIVTTIGERIGKQHLVPAQGASAELVAAGLIGSAGFSGLPVSTTHIVTSGVAGTMVGSRSGVQMGMLWQIAIAWVLTLPVTTVLAAAIFWSLAH
jgi:inorganic phosphate transporter, PiT family